MKLNHHQSMASDYIPVAVSGSISSTAEETLRLIAGLPAPAGLEDRVHAALRYAPSVGRLRQIFDTWAPSRRRFLAWIKALNPQSDRMRTAAAAAVVIVVAGGGWGINAYVQHAQSSQPAKVIVMPRNFQPGGFSGAGAIRTPLTLPGPTVILHAKTRPARHKSLKKPAARPAHGPAESARAAGAATLTAQ